MNPLPAVYRAATLVRPRPEAWGPLALERWSGRLVEVSEARWSGALTAVSTVLAQVQARGEPVAWVSLGPSIFFPPDLAHRGLDVEAITVVRGLAATAALQSGEWLVKSGGFGLVIFDGAGPFLDEAALGRLAKLAADQNTAVVFLTKKSDAVPSLGTQVSLRLTVVPAPGGAWVTVLKDKRAGVRLRHQEAWDGPFGLY